MSGSYTILQYMMPGLGMIAGMLMCALLCGLMGIRLAKRYQRSWISVVPCVLLLFLFWITAPTFLSSMEPTDELYPNDGYEIRKTAGVLEKITPAYRNWVCRTDYWTIDGELYYVFADTPAQEEMYLLLEYATTEERVIFYWQESDPDTAAAVLQQQAEADLLPKPEPPGLPQWRVELSRWTTEIGFCGFLAMIGLMTAFRERITFWLSERDLRRTRGIVLDPVGVMITAVPMLFMMLIILGDLLSGQTSFGLMIPPFIVIAGAFALRSFPWGMAVDGQNITLHRWGRERCYTVKDITALRYRPVKGFAARTMEVVFCDGESWEFDVNSHLGVQNTFLYLQERRKDH